MIALVLISACVSALSVCSTTAVPSTVTCSVIWPTSSLASIRLNRVRRDVEIFGQKARKPAAETFTS